MAEEERTTEEIRREEAEPWEQWEGNLVKWTIIAGVIALAILGIIVNIFVL